VADVAAAMLGPGTINSSSVGSLLSLERLKIGKDILTLVSTLLPSEEGSLDQL
jgi:hypothetical protein